MTLENDSVASPSSIRSRHDIIRQEHAGAYSRADQHEASAIAAFIRSAGIVHGNKLNYRLHYVAIGTIKLAVRHSTRINGATLCSFRYHVHSLYPMPGIYAIIQALPLNPVLKQRHDYLSR